MQTTYNSTGLAALLGQHLELIHQGKVRDSYSLPSHPRDKLRLVVVSDRASIFDFKLGFEIPGKGEILNAFNIAGRSLLKKEIFGFQDDLVSYGKWIDEFLPAALRGIPELHARATVVYELPMVKIESVVRGHLTGSAYKAYKNREKICGHDLGMKGMQEGTALYPPIFTPTTKADDGHDLPLDYQEVEKEYPGLQALSLEIFSVFYQAARRAGITVADTKFEFGYRQQIVPRRKIYVLADEALTPDSSRFWDIDEFDEAFMEKKLPQPLDKQMLRNWGKRMHIDEFDPENPEDQKQVGYLVAPPSVLEEYRAAMLRAFKMLHGISLDAYHRKVMGIKV